MPSQPPLPQPSADDHHASLSTVMAALAKLNVEISIEDLLKGVREVEEANRPQSKFSVTRNLPPRPTEPTASLNLCPVAKSIPNPTEPPNPNPLAEKRHRLLLELAEHTFPNGPQPPWTVRFGCSQDLSTSEPVAGCDPASNKPAPLELRLAPES